MTNFPTAFFFHCGVRKTGLFGSFQASHSFTAGSSRPSAPIVLPLYRFAAA